ncbi:hypothetical protein [Streptomyces sp. NBC_00259]|nr:hypothetical protein [Streptomyces sp. NBC_00259]
MESGRGTIGELEQQVLDLSTEPAQRHEDVAAARVASRELTAQLDR